MSRNHLFTNKRTWKLWLLTDLLIKFVLEKSGWSCVKSIRYKNGFLCLPKCVLEPQYTCGKRFSVLYKTKRELLAVKHGGGSITFSSSSSYSNQLKYLMHLIKVSHAWFWLASGAMALTSKCFVMLIIKTCQKISFFIFLNITVKKSGFCHVYCIITSRNYSISFFFQNWD